MSLKKVANVVGLLLVFLGLAMFATALLAAFYRGDDSRGFFLSGIVTVAFGFLLYVTTRFEGDITAREGFATVTMAWTAAGVSGGLPYLLTGVLDSPVAAIFESMSGFTTTGATVFADIESLPHGVLFWRALTHWLGGMGIIVLVIAVLPFLGVGGMQLFRAEVPGPTPERLRPRIAQTAKLLWLVYFGLTAAEAILYLFGGMSVFDAVTHAFSTMATGGFSTKNASMAAYSPYVQWVTILFMYLAGMNFALHFRAATGRIGYFKDQEWKFFTGVLVVASIAIVAVNLLEGTQGSLEPVIREAVFQVVAITTTTGFVNADYERWVPGAQMVLFALFFVGGMAGSTAGGIKTVRVMLLLKHTGNEIRRQLHPRAVFVTRIGSTPVKQEVIARVVGFVILYLLLCMAGALALGFTGVDPLSAIGATIASVGNVGPAFAELGPMDNYGWMTSPGLVVLSFLMLVGRLEIYTVLLLFHPELWKSRGSFH
jgi:trk system potassium uptake protein TrkH